MPSSIINVESGSQDLSAAALDFTTSTGIDWQSNAISLNFTTVISRNVTISINDGTTDFILISKTAWSGQNLVITDKIRLDKNEEIRIQINQTSGTVNYFVNKENV